MKDLHWKYFASRDRTIYIYDYFKARKWHLAAYSDMGNECDPDAIEYVKINDMLLLTTSAVGIGLSKIAEICFRNAGSKVKTFLDGHGVAARGPQAETPDIPR